MVKHIVRPTCVLDGSKMQSLEGSDLYVMLLDPVVCFVEKCCVRTVRNMRAELVASAILTRNADGFKKNLRDKIGVHGILQYPNLPIIGYA